MKLLLNLYAFWQRAVLVVIAAALTAGAFAFGPIIGLMVGYLLAVIVIATWKRLPS